MRGESTKSSSPPNGSHDAAGRDLRRVGVHPDHGYPVAWRRIQPPH
jgi:hypothetical protein